jgi:hypothetical protein
MARGRAERARRGTASGTEPARRGVPKAGSGDAQSVEGNLRERVRILEEERDGLLLGLHRAEARIQSLEKTQAHVRDRIAWALDSLLTVLGGKG